MKNSSSTFGWETFYSEFADKLLGYKDNRKELLKILEESCKEVGQKFPFTEKNGETMDDICPFTVFGAFNKGTSNTNRIALMQAIGNRFGVTSPVPSLFDGIPVLNPMKAWFFGYLADRQPMTLTICEI